MKSKYIISAILLNGAYACSNTLGGDSSYAKRAVNNADGSSAAIEDNRINLAEMSIQKFGSAPSLRDSRKKKNKATRRRDSPAVVQSRSGIPKNPLFSDDDFFSMGFLERQEGPQCELPKELSYGYDGDRRRGYKKVVNGIYCNRGMNSGSRCFFMCQRGSRLVTTETSTKKFKCKCQGEECKWSSSLDDVKCEERAMRRKTRKLHIADFEI